MLAPRKGEQPVDLPVERPYKRKTHEPVLCLGSTPEAPTCESTQRIPCRAASDFFTQPPVLFRSPCTCFLAQALTPEALHLVARVRESHQTCSVAFELDPHAVSTRKTALLVSCSGVVVQHSHQLCLTPGWAAESIIRVFLAFLYTSGMACSKKFDTSHQSAAPTEEQPPAAPAPQPSERRRAPSPASPGPRRQVEPAKGRPSRIKVPQACGSSTLRIQRTAS